MKKSTFDISRVFILLAVFIVFSSKNIHSKTENLDQEVLRGIATIDNIDKRFGQPFFFFKTNAKDPYMTICDPLRGELSVTFFGTQQESGSTGHIKKGDYESFKHLLPLRHTKYFVDAGVKEDIKYQGFWEDKIPGNLIENVLFNTQVLPKRNYPENEFVKIYKKGLPGFMLFEEQEQIQHFCSHLKTLFEFNGIIPQDEKPFIILEITNGCLENLPQETINFLNSFFIIIKIDQSKKEIKTAFQEFQKNYYDMLNITKGSSTVGETIMEQIINMFEKDGHKFDYKMITFWVAAITVPFFFKPVRESCENLVNDHSDKIRLGLTASAALLCSWMTKNMLLKKGTKSHKAFIPGGRNIAKKRNFTKTEIGSIFAGLLATAGAIWASKKLVERIKNPPQQKVDVASQVENLDQQA
jgi:hypothetical protein